MANIIQLKRGTGSAVPSQGSLAVGELAINIDSGKLYYGSGSSVLSDFRFDKITAETYVISSSVTHMTTSFSSGSTAFGDSAGDAHTFTGDITASGNISSSGNIYATDYFDNGTNISSIYQPTLTFGIADTNVFRANANVADNDFLRVDGTSIEGRTAAQVRSDIGAASTDALVAQTSPTDGAFLIADDGRSMVDSVLSQSGTVVSSTGHISSSTNIYAADYFDNGANINTIYSPIASPTFTGTIAIPNIANVETAIAANTAKATNVSTNLTATTHASQITINSSDGDNVVIAEASDTIAGLMTTTHHDKLDGIEASATADQTQADINGLAITTVGALGSGTIASGFGNIDNGTSTLDTGVATVASLVCTADATFGGGYGTTGATIATTGAITTDSTLTSTGLIILGSAALGGYTKFYEGTNNGTNYMALRAPAAVTTTTILYLPDGDGSANQIMKTDGSGNLSWTDAGGGGSTQKVYFNGGVNLQYAYNRFLPIGSYYVVEQNTDANPEFTTFVAPYDGKLIKTMLRSEEALGDTSLTWYKVGDGTEEPDQGSTVDTKTVDIASAATTYTYTYDSDATFSKGDAMSVAIDPTTDPVGAGVSYTIVMEFDEST